MRAGQVRGVRWDGQTQPVECGAAQRFVTGVDQDDGAHAQRDTEHNRQGFWEAGEEGEQDERQDDHHGQPGDVGAEFKAADQGAGREGQGVVGVQGRLGLLQVGLAQGLPVAQVAGVTVLAAGDEGKQVAQGLGVGDGAGGVAPEEGMVLERVVHGGSVRAGGSRGQEVTDRQSRSWSILCVDIQCYISLVQSQELTR